MHQDYVKMFVLIAIVSRGVRVFANPGRNICSGYQVKEKKRNSPFSQLA